MVFNIKAVVRETGIPADTLRAWERRYGVPRPERSAGRQRIYSRRDIQLIKSRAPGHFLGEELTVGMRAAEWLLLSPKPHPLVQQAPDPVR